MKSRLEMLQDIRERVEFDLVNLEINEIGLEREKSKQGFSIKDNTKQLQAFRNAEKQNEAAKMSSELKLEIVLKMINEHEQ